LGIGPNPQTPKPQNPNPQTQTPKNFKNNLKNFLL